MYKISVRCLKPKFEKVKCRVTFLLVQISTDCFHRHMVHLEPRIYDISY